MISKRFSGDIHTALALASASAAGFTLEEASIIAEHAHDPDFEDVLFDRGWMHVYHPMTGFGGAADQTSKKYMTAVNNKDVKDLGRASHYIGDIASVFHTTFSGQGYHKFYEEFLDIVYGRIIPSTVAQTDEVTDVRQMAVDFASEVYPHFPVILGSIKAWNEPVLIAESKYLLEQAARHITSMFMKYRSDVAYNVQYVVPLQPGLNTQMALAVAPFLFLSPF